MTIAVDLGRLANIQTHSCCFLFIIHKVVFLCFVYALFDCIELFVPKCFLKTTMNDRIFGNLK